MDENLSIYGLKYLTSKVLVFLIIFNIYRPTQESKNGWSFSISHKTLLAVGLLLLETLFFTALTNSLAQKLFMTLVFKVLQPNLTVLHKP